MEVQREEFDSLVASVRRMETALLGDEGLKVEGMAHKVHRHEEYIVDVEKWKNKGAGMILAFCFIVAGLYELGKVFFHKLF